MERLQRLTPQDVKDAGLEALEALDQHHLGEEGEVVV